MVAALNADCALLNSGTLRSDELHKAGEFSLRVRAIFLFPADEMVTSIIRQDLLAILPMMDDLILLDVSGDMIHKVRRHFMHNSEPYIYDFVAPENLAVKWP